jgi:hypothetical protein
MAEPSIFKTTWLKVHGCQAFLEPDKLAMPRL